MSRHYLQVTFSGGRPVVAYLQLDRKPGDKAARTKEAEDGLVVDFAADGRPIGIEITSPSRFTLESLNRLMISLNLAPANATDVAPLVAT